MEWLEGLETDALLQAMEQQLQPDLPTFSVQQLFEQLLNGDLQLDLGQLLQQLGHAVWSAATVQMDFLGQLILLAIAFAVLRQLESSFSGGNIQKVTGLVIQSIAVLLILQSSQLILQECQDAINRMTGMMEMLLPIQMLLMAGLGNVKTAGLLQPSLLLVVQITAFCVKHFLMPLITLELLLKLVNSFSDTYKLSSLAAFLKKLILTGISFGTMLFLAILSIQGISGHALDSIIFACSQICDKCGSSCGGRHAFGVIGYLAQRRYDDPQCSGLCRPVGNFTADGAACVKNFGVVFYV